MIQNWDQHWSQEFCISQALVWFHVNKKDFDKGLEFSQNPRHALHFPVISMLCCWKQWGGSFALCKGKICGELLALILDSRFLEKCLRASSFQMNTPQGCARWRKPEWWQGLILWEDFYTLPFSRILPSLMAEVTEQHTAMKLFH